MQQQEAPNKSAESPEPNKKDYEKELNEIKGL